MSGGKNHVTKRLAGDWLENGNKSIETRVERLSSNPGYLKCHGTVASIYSYHIYTLPGLVVF